MYKNIGIWEYRSFEKLCAFVVNLVENRKCEGERETYSTGKTSLIIPYSYIPIFLYSHPPFSSRFAASHSASISASDMAVRSLPACDSMYSNRRLNF